MKIKNWNYRVIKQTTETGDLYAIHEVYYENNKPTSCTQNPAWPSGETAEELKKDCLRFLEAFNLPFLGYNDFK